MFESPSVRLQETFQNAVVGFRGVCEELSEGECQVILENIQEEGSDALREVAERMSLLLQQGDEFYDMRDLRSDEDE